MFLMNGNVIVTTKELFIGTVMIIINHVPRSPMDFMYFQHQAYACKHPY